MNIKNRKDHRGSKVEEPRESSPAQDPIPSIPITHKYGINTQRAGGYKYACDAGQIA